MSSPSVDVESLWDFAKPEASERRFRDALTTATGDDVLILQTQIARTHSLRRDFERAREILAGAPDPYVFEELGHLYQAKNDILNAERCAARLRATKAAHGA